MSGDLQVSIAEGVCEIQINRPQTKNSFVHTMYREFAEALEQAGADDDVRVALVYGAAENFSSGNDLKDFVLNPPTSAKSTVFRFMQTLHGFSKPMLAAVDGFAVGIGTTMLLHCDVVYATPRAKFLLPFLNLGVIPEAASTLLLPRTAGLRLASEMLLFGEMFDVNTALAAGLVSRVIESEELMAHARKRAAQLAQRPANVVRQIKALLKRELDQAIAERIDIEAELFCATLREPPAQEAIQAFLRKKEK
jgi:enoyl-CoA hydratase/carnithine racemase